MQYLRLLLLPLSVIYGLIIRLRNKAYDLGIFASEKFDIPVISVGNLAVGGAGKSPMAEYLVRLLMEQRKVAVLSRGYGRKTKGYRLINSTDSAAQSGDEPLQIKRKFKNITVAVAEKRVEGIKKLESSHDLIILDDAFQHRAVQPDLSILLFDYTRLNDYLIMLPAGNLREPFSSRKRANLIVITKTPEQLSTEERNKITKRIKLFPHQQIFFSYLVYEDLVPVFDDCFESTLSHSLQRVNLESKRPQSIFLLTGIANPYPLLEKLSGFTKKIKHHDYPDHHPFNRKNIAKLVAEFSADLSHDKIIITTEKDAQRLKSAELQELLKNLPVYYLPVSARIHSPGESAFNHIIEKYATRHLQHNGIY